MLKKLFLTAAATVILTGAAMTATVPAQAATTCKEAAKTKYPDLVKGLKDRHAYKQACKQAWKASTGKTGLIGKLKLKG